MFKARPSVTGEEETEETTMSLPTAPAVSYRTTPKPAAARGLRGRRLTWPFSQTESIAEIAAGWGVWYLLDTSLFPAGLRDNHALIVYFGWVCFVLANACALSAISFLRALKGGTPGVSRTAYAAMAFPFWQTAGYFALVTSSGKALILWPTSAFFVLVFSLPAQLVVSVIAASDRSANQTHSWSGLSLLCCVAWYIFLLTTYFKPSF